MGEHENPAMRAERLLLDVVGERNFRHLKHIGYVDIPSRRVRGRTYRLDALGNLSYRDAGESGFHTTLCIEPLEAVPRDDLVAMRYLMVTADEERLLQTANVITFGFASLTRALYHDFSQRRPRWGAALLTAALLGFFLGSLAAIVWLVANVLPNNPVVAFGSLVALMIPATIGLVLVVAAVTDFVRFIAVSLARLRTTDSEPSEPSPA